MQISSMSTINGNVTSGIYEALLGGNEVKKTIIHSMLAVSPLGLANHEVIVDQTTAAQFGINYPAVQEAFQRIHDVQLTPETLLKVGFDEEGRALDFSTFDNLSISVSHEISRPAPNKGGIE